MHFVCFDACWCLQGKATHYKKLWCDKAFVVSFLGRGINGMPHCRFDVWITVDYFRAAHGFGVFVLPVCFAVERGQKHKLVPNIIPNESKHENQINAAALVPSISLMVRFKALFFSVIHQLMKSKHTKFTCSAGQIRLRIFMSMSDVGFMLICTMFTSREVCGANAKYI